MCDICVCDVFVSGLFSRFDLVAWDLWMGGIGAGCVFSKNV